MVTTTSGKALRTSLTACALVAMVGGAAVSAGGQAAPVAGVRTSSARVTSPTENRSQASVQHTTRIALYTAMRTLWTQHMEWTYATVVAFADESPALEPTITRLLRNQADIGNAFATYYGSRAGGRLTDLLQTHIKDAVPVLTAAKAGDTTAFDQAVAQWYANAQDIADFLAAANPHWKQADMRSMMRTHITQTVAYAADVLAGSFATAIERYDAAESHMAEMADMLSAGIIKQFPQRFSARAVSAART
jgi:hypothetical protein